eukprot:3638025-Prymnesium_polylepis.1
MARVCVVLVCLLRSSVVRACTSDPLWHKALCWAWDAPARAVTGMACYDLKPRMPGLALTFFIA